MSAVEMAIVGGVAGGAAWAAITAAAAIWFNRRVGKQAGRPEADAGGSHIYICGHGHVYVPRKRVR